MLYQWLDRTRGEAVVLEQDIRVHWIQHLYETAEPAAMDLKGIQFFRAINASRLGRKPSGQRQRPEVQHGMQVRALARPAMGSHLEIPSFNSSFKSGLTPKNALKAKARYLPKIIAV